MNGNGCGNSEKKNRSRISIRNRLAQIEIDMRLSDIQYYSFGRCLRVRARIMIAGMPNIINWRNFCFHFIAFDVARS